MSAGDYIVRAMNSMLPRIINTQQNRRVGMIPKVFQRNIYRHGELYPAGLEGGCPSWVYAEMTLAAQATDDTTLALPVGFNLLSMMGISLLYDASTPPVLQNTQGDFRVQIYDVNGQRDFIPGKAVNGGNIGGNLGRVSFLTHPYFFAGDEPQVQIRLSNLNAQFQAQVQFCLYGSQGVFPK